MIAVNLSDRDSYMAKPQSKFSWIDGIGSSQAIDTAGEIVDLKGLDCSSLVGGAFNFEHKNDTPHQIVGKIVAYKKIFSKDDCENERHLKFWNKFKIPFLYVMGRLFDDKKESSKEIAAIFKDDAEHPNEIPSIGFSIEGSKINKSGMTITHSIARRVTCTASPANKTCVAELIPDKIVNDKKDFSSLFKSEILDSDVEFEMLLKKEENNKMPPAAKPKESSNPGANQPGAPMALAEKKPSLAAPKLPHQNAMPTAPAHGAPLGRTKSGKNVFSHAKIHDYMDMSSADHHEAANMHHEAAQAAKDPKTGSHHLDKMKLHLQAAGTSEKKEGRFAIGRQAAKQKALIHARMNKAVSAGSGMAAPSELTQGAALQKESLDKKKWLARAEEEYSSWGKKEQFRSFIKNKLPKLTLGEIDALGKVVALNKSMKMEKALAELAKADKIPGGLADKKKPEDFDPEALAEGIKVEMEHTSDRSIAQEIAMDHLTEDKDYYKKLKVIESDKPLKKQSDILMASEKKK